MKDKNPHVSRLKSTIVTLIKIPVFLHRHDHTLCYLWVTVITVQRVYHVLINNSYVIWRPIQLTHEHCQSILHQKIYTPYTTLVAGKGASLLAVILLLHKSLMWRHSTVFMKDRIFGVTSWKIELFDVPSFYRSDGSWIFFWCDVLPFSCVSNFFMWRRSTVFVSLLFDRLKQEYMDILHIKMCTFFWSSGGL